MGSECSRGGGGSAAELRSARGRHVVASSEIAFSDFAEPRDCPSALTLFPEFSVKGAILDSFSDVCKLDIFARVKVGYGSGDS